MKHIQRLLSFALVLVMLMTLCPVVLPTAAADGEGLTFTALDMYSPVKTYADAPNTFEAWIKLPKSASANRSGVILGNYGAGYSVINFEVHQSGSPRLYWTESNGKNSDWIFTNINVCTGDWVHVAITRDVDAGKVHCYVDGVLKQSLSIAADKGREDTIPSGGLCVGGDVRSGNAQYFKGAIREIAVFSTVRTADEINDDMLMPYGEDGLLAYYDLTLAESGTDIPDDSDQGCNLRYIYNVTWIDPKDKAPVTDYAYSFAVIGDTQVINEKHPDQFQGIYDWIIDNVDDKKIEFVFGLGDITERSTQAEWERAIQGIHSMDGIVEYSIVRGNHDSVSTFNAAFPWKDYEDIFDGSYDDTMINTYRTLSVGKIDYLLITLDFGASNAVLEWAGALCEEYPDHNVIITTHSYLFRDGTTLDQGDVCPPATNGGYNNGDHTWDKLISKHENIVLVISGHDPCDRIIVAQDEGENGNIVTQMLVDPQGADAQLGGLGMVAMLYFSEDGREVTVEYYSTIQEKFYLGANQFTLTLDLVGKEDEQPPAQAPEGPTTGTEEPGNDTDEPPTDDTTPDTPDTQDSLPTGVWIGIIIAVVVICLALGLTIGLLAAKKKKA